MDQLSPIIPIEQYAFTKTFSFYIFRITSIHVFFDPPCVFLTCLNMICSTRRTGASLDLRRTWSNHRRPHSWFLWRRKKRRWFLSLGKFLLHSKIVRQYLISCQSRFCNKRIRHHLFAEKPSLRVIWRVANIFSLQSKQSMQKFWVGMIQIKREVDAQVVFHELRKFSWNLRP